MVAQCGVGIITERAGAGGGRPICNAAGGIGRAIAAVGGQCDNGDTVHAVERQRRRQCHLLVAPAHARVVAKRHRRFATQDQARRRGGRAVMHLHFAPKRHGHACHFACLPLKEGGQDGGVVTAARRGGAGSLRRQRVVAHNHGDGVNQRRVTRLGCVGQRTSQPCAQMCGHGCGQPRRQCIALDDVPRVGPGGAVGHGGSRGDYVKRAAHDIREDECHQTRRGHGLRQSPTLDERQVLAHGVELIDGRTACQQQCSGRLQVGQRQWRRQRLEQCRATTRKQADDEVVRPGASGQCEHFCTCVQPGLRGHGVARLAQLHVRRGRAVPLFHDHRASGNPLAHYLFHGLCHGRAGLACAQHNHAPHGAQVNRRRAHEQGIVLNAQRSSHGTRRVHSVERGFKDGAVAGGNVREHGMSRGRKESPNEMADD